MTEKHSERCEIRFVPHPVRGVDFVLEGDCKDTLKIVEALPPRRRRYYKRRIVIKE